MYAYMCTFIKHFIYINVQLDIWTRSAEGASRIWPAGLKFDTPDTVTGKEGYLIGINQSIDRLIDPKNPVKSH